MAQNLKLFQKIIVVAENTALHLLLNMLEDDHSGTFICNAPHWFPWELDNVGFKTIVKAG